MKEQEQEEEEEDVAAEMVGVVIGGVFMRSPTDE